MIITRKKFKADIILEITKLEIRVSNCLVHDLSYKKEHILEV
jgi:hypothetical protein